MTSSTRLTAKRLSKDLIPSLAEGLRADGFAVDESGTYLSRRTGEVESRIVPVISSSKQGGCKVEVYLHLHVDSVDRLWRPHLLSDEARRLGSSAYAVYFGNVAPAALSSVAVSQESEIPTAAGNLVRALRQYALPHLRALASVRKLRERLDAERARGYALTVRDICVYVILLAIEGRQDEVPALAAELKRPLKKQFADAARRKIEADIDRLVAALTTGS